MRKPRPSTIRRKRRQRMEALKVAAVFAGFAVITPVCGLLAYAWGTGLLAA